MRVWRFLSLSRSIRRLRFDSQRAKYHFIHIPKNAGLSVRRALYLHMDISLSDPYHYRYVDIAEKAGRHLRFFAIVRNPWSRTASRFQYGKQNLHKWPIKDPRREFMENATFADFVREQRIMPIPAHPGMPWMGPLNSWFNQLEWLRDESGDVKCDCVRMEHLEYDLSAYLNRPLHIVHRNVTKVQYDYRSMFNSELAELVATLFAEDIDYFGFSFDSSATKNVFST